MWFKEFGLVDDPFKTTDFYTERRLNAPIVLTRQIRLIKILKGFKFIVGEAGCGKSTALYYASQYKTVNEEYEEYFTVIGSRSITEFYNNFFKELFTFLSKYTHPYEEEDILSEYVKVEWFDLSRKEAVCKYPRCKKDSCVLGDLTDLVAEWKSRNQAAYKLLSNHLLRFEKYCPLRVDLVEKLVETLKDSFQTDSPLKFLLDVPDNLSKDEVEYFIRVFHGLQDIPNVSVIIMATPDQYHRLKQFDIFKRLSCMSFEHVSNEELREILMKRIEWKKDKTQNYPEIFSEDAVRFIIERSIRNPRRMFQICTEVLTEMKLNNMSSSADVKFVNISSPTARNYSFEYLVELLVQRYIENKTKEKTVFEIQMDLEREFNFSADAIALGRKLRKMYKEGKIIGYSPRGCFTDDDGRRHDNVAKYYFYVGE